MLLHGADVLPLDIIPLAQYPPKSLGYVSCLHACLGSTDTVLISPSYGVDELMGMILETDFDLSRVSSDDDLPMHPYISNTVSPEPDCFFKLQIYMNKKIAPSSIVEAWPHLNADLPDTIPAAAPTNCILWVHSSQVCGLAFFPHAYHCINQTDGNVSGRMELFHVDHSLSIHISPDSRFVCDFQRLTATGPDSYNMFGHPRHQNISSYISFSERMHESMCLLSRKIFCLVKFDVLKAVKLYKVLRVSRMVL